MNKHQTVITVILGCCLQITLAQSISPSVISTAGGLASNGGGSLSYTVGEMAMIETFSAKAHFLTQGFQQPWDFITTVDDPSSSIGIGVYPNPASGFFYVQLQSNLFTKAQLSMTDVLGSQVYFDIAEISSAVLVHQISTTHLPAGIYVLSIKGLGDRGQDGGLVTTKIHIAN
jgi:hypothetical protein